MSIEKLKANYPVKIHWVHFPLHPETPPEGKSLAELFAGRNIEPMREKMRALMQEAGLPYGERTHTYNSRLAQELGAWGDSLGEDSLGDTHLSLRDTHSAATLGDTHSVGDKLHDATLGDTHSVGDKLHDALYRAYFAEAINIGDIEQLVEIAGRTGLDREEARRVLQERRFKSVVDADWARSRSAGITGVPTFTYGDLVVVGCQPYEFLERFVQHIISNQAEADKT